MVMMMFQLGCFYLLLVAVLQLCVQKVQSDGLPEVNDLNRERKQGKTEGEGQHQSAGITSKFSFKIRST